MQSLFRLFLSNRQYGRSLLLAAAFMLFAVILNLLQPKLIEWAIDQGIRAGNITNIINGGIGILLAALVANGFTFVSGYLMVSLGQNMGYELRNSLFAKVMSFSFSNLDKWRTGELLVRMNADVNTTRMFVRMGLLMIIQSLFMITGGLVIMFMTDTGLAGAVAVAVPLVLFLFLFTASRVRPLFLKVRESLDKINNVLQENLAGAKIVRAYNRQQHEVERFAVENRNFFKISLKTGYLIALLFPLLFFIGNLILAAILWFGGREVIESLLMRPSGGAGAQGLSLGELVAFNNYALLIMFPIFMLGVVLNFIAMASASASRIEELLHEQVQILECEQPVTLEKLSGKIEFRGVSFRYGAGERVLDQINLVIRPGEKIGILGPTGAGKSTLVQLIPRLYDPETGSICIDDIEVKSLALSTLRTRVSMVLQETVLFSGTIKDNLLFGRPEATDEELEWAVHLAGAAEFVSRKANGWEEVLGERGQGLSGGQRQRLAIARAVLADPDILILDDATSAVDLETEKKIIANLYRERAGKTTLIISQKINTIREADRILVFENGRITASGAHDELLTASEFYREIAASQSTQFMS